MARSQPLQAALHLEGPQAQDHAEGDGLGVHAVGAADHDRVAVLERPALQDPAQRLRVSSASSAAGRPQLQGQPGVEHVRRGQAVVDVLGGLAHVLGHAADEGDDVVLGDLLDLVHPVDVESRPSP